MSWRALTPLGWIGMVIAVVVVAAVMAGALGFRFDPFQLERRRAERAETEAASARTGATARALEVEGERAQARRLEVVRHDVEAAEAATRSLETEARRADDAAEPLDAGRVARLRAHDRELCRLAELRGCPAAIESAPAGDPVLRPSPSAGTSDRG